MKFKELSNLGELEGRTITTAKVVDEAMVLVCSDNTFCFIAEKGFGGSDDDSIITTVKLEDARDVITDSSLIQLGLVSKDWLVARDARLCVEGLARQEEYELETLKRLKEKYGDRMTKVFIVKIAVDIRDNYSCGSHTVCDTHVYSCRPKAAELDKVHGLGLYDHQISTLDTDDYVKSDNYEIYIEEVKIIEKLDD